MKSAFLVTLSIALLTLGACRNNNNSGIQGIEVSWELISNQADSVPAALAKFTFTNKTGKDWIDTTWAFYFNQSPRNIIRYECDQPVTFKRISGDWYCIKPRKGFTLKAGQSLSLEYLVEAWWIKISDAPAGAYWAFQRSDQSVVQPTVVKIAPFQRPEQFSRFKNDREPIPNAEYDFEKYEGMEVIPMSKIPPVVPFPVSVTQKAGFAMLGPQVVINASDALKNEKELLMQWLRLHTGLKVDDQIPTSRQPYVIHLRLDKGLGRDKEEAYKLTVKEREAFIEASSAKGVFYGCQTVQGLLPVDSLLRKTSSYRIPCLEIEDYPRFAYRGMHIDVTRNFIPLDNILKIIDLLSFYKINVLHLHLTDDEGWRIEIPALPELTNIGGFRGHTSKEAPSLHPSYGSGPNRVGGFYSRNDFIKLLKYASQRHILVIPEINMPGHSRAAIKAMEARYIRLMKQGNATAAEAFRLIDPSDTSHYQSAQYYDDNVVCVVKEEVYHFMETVIKELVDQYAAAGLKLEMLHLGGDEVPHNAWKGSPLVAQWLQEHPEYKVENLHAYYVERIMKILRKYNIRGGGWEEVALKKENGRFEVNPAFAGGDLVPYVWNNLWGSQDLAYRLANRNYPVVLSHVTSLYFDLSYSKSPEEPGLYWGGFVDEYKTWFYNSVNVFQTTRKDELGREIKVEVEYQNMERLKPHALKNILGLQAQLWGETMINPTLAEYYMLPKLISFAQVAWGTMRRWESVQNTSVNENVLKEDWNVFANALGQREVPRLAVLQKGFRYRIPTPGVKIENKRVHVNVSWPGLVVRYASAGQLLSSRSPILAPGEHLPWEQGLQLAAFDKANNHSKIIVIE